MGRFYDKTQGCTFRLKRREIDMLVLSRKNREAVVVGSSNSSEERLRVTVLEIRRGRVTLGIEGDRDVPVYRCEIWDQIHADEKQGIPQACR
jgi:carbon storage regulator CsrA